MGREGERERRVLRRMFRGRWGECGGADAGEGEEEVEVDVEEGAVESGEEGEGWKVVMKACGGLVGGGRTMKDEGWMPRW